MDVQLPTKVRLIAPQEYQIVSRVIGCTLHGRAFAIPSSLVTMAFGIFPINRFSISLVGTWEA